MEESARRPGMVQVVTTLVSLACLAAILVMLPLAGMELLDVGGFCAEGGPYVIRQECPEGVIPVLGAGIPLLFVFGLAYTLAIPAGWRFLLVWAWPILFFGIAAAFFVSTFTAPGQSFAVAPFITGIVMAGIGLFPVAGIPIIPSPGRAASSGEHAPKGSLALQLGFVVAGGFGGYLLWTAIV